MLAFVVVEPLSAAAIIDLADQCVQCGACLPHCPTYKESASEAESPRGRILIAKALASERLSPVQVIASIDSCLGCRRCEAMCPAKVDYGSLLLDARRRVRTARPAPTSLRILEWLLARPRWLSAALGVLARAPRGTRARRRLPRFGRAPARGLHPTPMTRRGRVLLFEGCVAQRLDGDAHRAAIRVLNQLGWDVDLLDTPRCCGSLHAHVGDHDGAAALRAALARDIDRLEPDQLIGCSSGCIEALRAAAGGTPCSEIMQFIGADAGLRSIPFRPAPSPALLHTPCTQRSVVKQPEAAADALRQVPELQLTRCPEHGCCGAAGSLRLTDPQRASRFAAPLIDWIDRQPAATVLSSNVGCRIHLELELAARGRTARCCHPIELLAEHLP